MAAILKPGTSVQTYKIIELVGDGTQSNVYLAERESKFYWLIQIEDPNFEPKVETAHVELLNAEGGEWAAFGMGGTTMVQLASWVDRLELPYIGWRWAKLAREIGFGHANHVVLQATQPLALERLVFNTAGELYAAQAARDVADEHVFRAPDSRGDLGPASDVFALGASLQALAGDKLPRGVQNVLTRATNPEASKRYANATEFSEALAQVLPNPNREKIVAPRKRSLWRWAAAVVFLVCGGLALCIGLLIALGLLITPTLPTQTATHEIPLLVTILDWQVQDACQAQVRVRAQDGQIVLTPNEGVQFSAATPQETISQVNPSPSETPGEYNLHFGMGNFCEKGGALTVNARTASKQGKSIVYYYPEAHAPENFVLYKVGGRQIRTNAYPRLRFYFSLTDADDKPAELGGSLVARLSQDGNPVQEFSMTRVQAAIDPLVAVLVIDTSKSMAGEPLAQAKQAAVKFIEQLDPQDFVCVYRFATQVQQVQVCSADHATAMEAVNKLTASGNTALNDVLLRVSEAHARKSERQAIILLSDGADTASRASQDQALAEMARLNIPVYTIGLGGGDLEPQVLKEIANQTSGVYLEAPTPQDLVTLYDRLAETLAKQYQVEFISIFPERKSGTIELILSNGNSEIRIERKFLVQP